MPSGLSSGLPRPPPRSLSSAFSVDSFFASTMNWLEGSRSDRVTVAHEGDPRAVRRPRRRRLSAVPFVSRSSDRVACREIHVSVPTGQQIALMSCFICNGR